MALIYSAGSLFNVGERVHQLLFEKYLKELGHEVVLPQKEALKFFVDGRFNLKALCQDCLRHAGNKHCYFVGNIDGADADSGTCIELDRAIVETGRAIIYRTDFRTDVSRELGYNLMLRMTGTHLIYEPCLVTEYNQIEPFYRKLVSRVHESILFLEAGGKYDEDLAQVENA